MLLLGVLLLGGTPSVSGPSGLIVQGLVLLMDLSWIFVVVPMLCVWLGQKSCFVWAWLVLMVAWRFVD